MSKLNFSQISDAFLLGSDQIKNTREEIQTLRKLLDDTALESNKFKQQKSNRIGPPDTTIATCSTSQKSNDDIDLLRIVQHPKFDDFAKKYILLKYPNLGNCNLQETSYVPKIQTTQKEQFGNQYSTTIYTNVSNYLIFFVLSISIYIFLKSILT